MKQYLNLLKAIKENGTIKPAARENMPGTTSLFGYQFRHNLQDGFPLLTTKKLSFKTIIIELLWFLRGDTNIKFLIDNSCNIWNEDAYNYYLKQCKISNQFAVNFDDFIEIIRRESNLKDLSSQHFENYIFGDCGYQYGKVWRKWNNYTLLPVQKRLNDVQITGANQFVDQITLLIEGLKNNPQSRRHILTSIDPAHDQDLALYWCHALTQFNCRPIPWEIKLDLAKRNSEIEMENLAITEAAAGSKQFGIVPQYYLDCQMYQRSADVFLGVPYNIASYALLTHILAKMCNMIPGEMIYSYGDVHIYDDHKEQVEEQLKRTPLDLPLFELGIQIDWTKDIDDVLTCLQLLPKEAFDNVFKPYNYNPQPSIKGKLSTGLK